MALAIGGLIAAGLSAAGVGGIAGLGTLSTVTVFGVGLPTILGSLAILAPPVGSQCVLCPEACT